ncbi:MAG TPA: flagellar basal body P-ring protein FlgI [Anaerohalosphaeraceae bacterium]|nr:flagellar basal body P-ring protein FlgI [Anaerohalosphaeraceae bacterium]HOM76524.1 flagellar basal body P-ring protein FlgI [Anaerohalosphaeraceae bacterium]HPC63909.1 flagellar basal body P-ring protein FlgI [Anaerohalosphaeraceae bacterium]HPO68663.1 flagellar basal body P-ring protein FlgI [Anaerohalosphaeraceae bacterium]HRS70831.1 flagellar basal body P-ring protein FlgI [Anaerohalosphaeraceae bacterium]
MIHSSIIKYLWVLPLLFGLIGCTQPAPTTNPAAAVDPRSTIGSISAYYANESVAVRGIGIVAGLAGTGSSECPPGIREELEKYIWKQMPNIAVNPRLFIESQNTAVVEIIGVIPPYATRQTAFDVIVRPLSSTQTTSLNGGYLYTAELKELSRLTNVGQFAQYSKTLAAAEGPIFTKLSQDASDRKWYVLGGGRPAEDGFVKLILKTPDFVAANAIRNRINERFGPKTAVPVSAGECNLFFPAKYLDQKERFLKMVQTLILADNPDIRNDYMQTLLDRLVRDSDKESAEIALEGIGKPVLDSLESLLEHNDPAVQFYAARCMLNIGDSRPLPVLRKIILEPASPYRIAAIRAVGQSAKRSDARPILLNALHDNDIQVRLAAYEMLGPMDSPEISRTLVAKGSFAIDRVLCSGPKMIYVYQQLSPRIVLFGSPLHCEKDIFIQSDDEMVTINARSGDKYITVSRKHPSRPRVVGPLSCSYELSSLIQTLGEVPDVKGTSAPRPGLNIPYADIIRILQKMCRQDAIKAQFIAGPEPEKNPLLQNLPVIGR